MYKLLRTKYTEFSQLPFDQFNELSMEIYITDCNWNYLFVNNFALKNIRGRNWSGKNMWQEFPELLTDSNFVSLKKNLEQQIVTNFTTPSRNMQKQNIVGYPLKDCFYISASLIPNKQDLIHELRSELNKKKI